MISDNVEFLTPIFYAVFLAAILKMADISKFWKCRIAPLMVTYHYVKFYVSIIIHLEVIPNIGKFLPVTILKMAATIPQKFNIVRYQRHFICG
jgi:hypothetical protein